MIEAKNEPTPVSDTLRMYFCGTGGVLGEETTYVSPTEKMSAPLQILTDALYKQFITPEYLHTKLNEAIQKNKIPDVIRKIQEIGKKIGLSAQPLLEQITFQVKEIPETTLNEIEKTLKCEHNKNIPLSVKIKLEEIIKKLEQRNFQFSIEELKFISDYTQGLKNHITPLNEQAIQEAFSAALHKTFLSVNDQTTTFPRYIQRLLGTLSPQEKKALQNDMENKGYTYPESLYRIDLQDKDKTPHWGYHGCEYYAPLMNPKGTSINPFNPGLWAFGAEKVAKIALKDMKQVIHTWLKNPENKNKQFQLHLAGHSRGAMSVFYLAKEMQNVFTAKDLERIDVHINVMDPVPGNLNTPLPKTKMSPTMSGKTKDLSRCHYIKSVTVRIDVAETRTDISGLAFRTHLPEFHPQTTLSVPVEPTDHAGRKLANLYKISKQLAVNACTFDKEDVINNKDTPLNHWIKSWIKETVKNKYNIKLDDIKTIEYSKNPKEKELGKYYIDNNRIMFWKKNENDQYDWFDIGSVSDFITKKPASESFKNEWQERKSQTGGSFGVIDQDSQQEFETGSFFINVKDYQLYIQWKQKPEETRASWLSTALEAFYPGHDAREKTHREGIIQHTQAYFTVYEQREKEQKRVSF